MNILIVGCGRVGCIIARQLEQLGHEVSVLDSDETRLENLYEFGHSGFHGIALSGVPIDVDVLRNAGIENCDAVLAVTHDDNINIMVSEVAQEVYHVGKVIARVSDPALKEVFADHFSMRTISPTNLTVAGIMASLFDDQRQQSVTFGSTSFCFKQHEVDHKYIGKEITRIPLPENLTLFGVQRKYSNVALCAAPNLILEEGDCLLVCETSD